MTLNEYEKLTDTDRAFLKLEGRCDGCGCKLNGEIYIVHADWCKDVPQFIWPKANLDRGFKRGEVQIISSSRQSGKSVFANMVNQLNKIFRKQYENTNS